ncbi:integration host factor, actinobacterial type [Streptomyces natalensis]|uniref:Integration host factor n=1 Tax=Streptomyces natalensis ATCC 27448 TaxID=1240678 RepID=A0A0D7CMD8_9ACTN|nr:integration host factor, actinobacterial type [Streptomyces natalensis]KIZ17389.1 integration host factor [Streptomyces natalensis ATCC 27448]
MTLPTMTAEQRSAALAKAATVRKARTELIEQVRKGRVSMAEVLKRADKEDLVKKTKLAAIIKALPGIGPVKAAKLMDEAEIPADRRIGGLGSRQRAALLEALKH